MKLNDLFSLDLLAERCSDGFVGVQCHKSLPFNILNYTPKTQYADLWDEITLNCRGLIYNWETMDVVARPWKKFFNGMKEDSVDIYWRPAHLWGPETPVEVTEKVDGSLGILYPDPNQPTGWAIATRGSFESDQAKHATVLYQTSHRLFKPTPGVTYLFEIVYPENRIVVDYGQDDALYLLGAVNITTGEYYSPRHYDLPRTSILPYSKFGDFVANFRPSPNREGVVVRNLLTQEMKKYKSDEYVALHRLLFGLNAVGVWEMLKNYHESPEPWNWKDFTGKYPADVAKWINAVADEIEAQYLDYIEQSRNTYNYIITSYADAETNRKEFAKYALETPNLSHFLFRLYDNKPIEEEVWKKVKPSGAWKPTGGQQVEDDE